MAVALDSVSVCYLMTSIIVEIAGQIKITLPEILPTKLTVPILSAC